MTGPVSILTVGEMAAADQAAIAAGAAGITLMERAGMAVAEAICERFSPRRTLVLAGPGNNGGDGYVIARGLRELGWDVSVAALGGPRTPDAQAARERWAGCAGAVSPELPDADLIVDALFGAGLDRPL